MLPTLSTASSAGLERKRIHVRGIVQGVGFRPFIYNLARGMGLSGHVLNCSSGVFIEAEGTSAALLEFIGRISSEAPPLAHVENISAEQLEICGVEGFTILNSVEESGEFVLVSPDVSTCEHCFRDFTDPANRRYGYPFTNCTNCGPRYTIIQDIPYDRPKTTMAGFKMCADCQAEYHDPANRRFHAQPNACPVCGPALALANQKSFAPENGHGFASGGLNLSILRDVRQLLRQGSIVAIRGLGGFQLACDAQNEEAVRLLRNRKRRSDKPFAVMARDIAAVESFCIVSDDDRKALMSLQRPIVILQRRPDSEAAIPADVSPHDNTLGVMLPYTPLHHLLFGESPDSPSEFTALVMTSGNISEEPIVTKNDEGWRRLHSVGDWFLLHNREIYMRLDDSVVRTFEGKTRALRRSRGFVPHPINLGMDMQEVLACGAELKNTFCLTKERYAILSQHIGDMENFETLVFFEETLNNLKKLFRVEPKAVTYDLHPDYLSTKFALKMDGLPKIGVQHHHAHIASCMAENGLREKVIGVAFDGTGYGTDGQVWGGEFLVADYTGFERRAHFRYVPMAGGNAAVREPWRMALSHLYDASASHDLDLAIYREVESKRLSLVENLITRRINTVQTSSCGRLFDAVASIIGLRQETNFEGQAAIELEQIAMNGVDEAYPFAIDDCEPWQIDTRPVIEAIVGDLKRNKPATHISAAFHNTLAEIIVEVCRRIRSRDGIRNVCLSGGTFQNMYLLRRAVAGLRSGGFEVFLHAEIPPNDGGISLGQAVIANERLRREG
ncbi:MAG: (NiFe) hydrogenase maturation protein HypF [Candidatus Angelobacter sp.]|jgi:hydrogenase maturation protein HypF|nr:(NiFe) hydrogenase maturation protein HypF [Candidatus Angelobacter sp.]